MRTYSPTAAKQRGFSLLTGFILSIIMFGTLAFFLAGQGINAGFGTAYTNKSKVSGLLASAGYINTGFDAVTLNGTLASAVTFDTADTTGVFSPVYGGSSQQVLDPNLFVGTDTPSTTLAAATGVRGFWIYRKSDIKLNAVGTAANEYTMLVAGLKQGICEQINETLHGVATATALTATLAQLVTAPLAGSNQVSGLVPAAIATDTKYGWLNGCYATSDTSYVYIHTLLAQ